MMMHRTEQTKSSGEGFLALEEHCIEALEQQAVLVARVVEVMEEDQWVLDTILALEVTFVVADALPLATAPPISWQLHTTH
ncbi:hypothetical protein Y1Q_0021055 [Alligator mississippiensis]|uniref:Uncharacterized protein n=1 Tax=Alligator mississippiensis TaxID=8496 RepID=A0A151NRB3_ALLMI|nr:hypothetical protein Y1Q_0021055 [Alligator mississippiensis]